MAGKGKSTPKAVDRFCVTCGKTHKAGLPGTYVMPSLLDPTEYACSQRCYAAWHATHPVPKSITEPRRHVDDDEMSIARDPGTPLFEV
jgi:hypothetical protein